MALFCGVGRRAARLTILTSRLNIATRRGKTCRQSFHRSVRHMKWKSADSASLPVTLKTAIEVATSDGVGAEDSPEHPGLFTRADEQMLAAELRVAHALGISLEVVRLGTNLFTTKEPVSRFCPGRADASGGPSSRLSSSPDRWGAVVAPDPTDAGRDRGSALRPDNVSRPNSQPRFQAPDRGAFESLPLSRWLRCRWSNPDPTSHTGFIGLTLTARFDSLYR